ncbi:MAG: hypothetical protein QOE54_2669 [Streptosporangiaceae bacterium]|jgi:hypothetical protein|nr:hypothetical protein [Streptosporangiaceae bacterium]
MTFISTTATKKTATEPGKDTFAAPASSSEQALSLLASIAADQHRSDARVSRANAGS